MLGETSIAATTCATLVKSLGYAVVINHMLHMVSAFKIDNFTIVVVVAAAPLLLLLLPTTCFCFLWPLLFIKK